MSRLESENCRLEACATIPDNLRRWESLIALLIAGTTPLVITPITADSYILPKIVWLSFLTAAWLILIAFQPSNGKRRACAVDWPVAALLAVSAATALIQYRTPLQFSALLHLALYITLFYCYLRYWSLGGSVFPIIHVLMASSCLIALYGILQDYGIDFTLSTGGVRDWRSKVISTLGNPNFLAGYLTIGLPLFIAYGLRKKAKWFHILAAAVAVLLVVACHAVTFSVGAATGLAGTAVIGLILSLLVFRRVRLPLGRTLLFLLIAASAAGWYLLDNPYNSHGRSLYKEAWESPQWWSGMGARQFIWQTTRIMIEEKPVMGIGFGNYLTVHEHYQGLNYSRQWHAHDRDYVIPVDQPHFQLLETAAECGPLGVLTRGWLAAAWLIAVIRRLKSDPENRWFVWGILLGVCVAVIHSFSSFPFHLPASSLLVAIVASYPISTPKREPSSPLPRPVWQKFVFVLFAILLCVTAFKQFAGNRYLRLGGETQGFQSLYNLERSRQFDPHSNLVHYQLSYHYLSQGWNGKAVESLWQAIHYQEDIHSHKLLARIYLQQNNLPEAIASLERIVELNPIFPGHYRELVEILKKAGRTDRIPELESKAAELEAQLKERE